MRPELDLVSIGRSSVDLYGQQIGGRLEGMASFAIGAARLGPRTGLITRVGDEHFGRFMPERLMRDGVDTDGVHTDPQVSTVLAILGVRDSSSFPRLFYRTGRADAALDESDIDPALLARTRAAGDRGRAGSGARQPAAVRNTRRSHRRRLAG